MMVIFRIARKDKTGAFGKVSHPVFHSDIVTASQKVMNYAEKTTDALIGWAISLR
jgi:hypothetical protein